MARKKAFTLVELLVVIAIIALLMSLLMPALARVRKQAKDVLGQANLKQWGMCFGMFTDDHESSFPAGWTDTTSAHPEYYWMHALRPYYGDAGDLRLCPMVAKVGTDVAGPGNYWWGGVPPDSTFIGWGRTTGDYGDVSNEWGWVMAGDYGSYGWNSWICDPPIEGHDEYYSWIEAEKYNWRKAFVKGGGDIPLLGDHQWVDCWPSHSDTVPEWKGKPWTSEQMTRICIDRHDGTVNWVFLDYSVRKIGLKQLWRLKWHRRSRPNEGPTKEEFDSAGDGWMKHYKDYE